MKTFRHRFVFPFNQHIGDGNDDFDEEPTDQRVSRMLHSMSSLPTIMLGRPTTSVTIRQGGYFLAKVMNDDNVRGGTQTVTWSLAELPYLAEGKFLLG